MYNFSDFAFTLTYCLVTVYCMFVYKVLVYTLSIYMQGVALHLYSLQSLNDQLLIFCKRINVHKGSGTFFTIAAVTIWSLTANALACPTTPLTFSFSLCLYIMGIFYTAELKHNSFYGPVYLQFCFHSRGTACRGGLLIM